MKHRVVLAMVGSAMLLGLMPPGLIEAKVPGPNGQIAFARFRPAHEDFATFTINPNGTHEQRLLPGGSELPHWAPFGKRVSVLACLNPPACTTAVGIVDPDSGRVRTLLMPDPTLFTACPVWSADGTRLACGALSEDDPSRNGLYTIRRSTGRDLTRVTSNPGGEDRAGDYSPDNTRIVFVRSDPNRPEGRNRAVFVVRLSNHHVRRISPWGLPEGLASWSPNGGKILFAGGGRLFVVRPNGEGLRRIWLGVEGGAFDPAWSPNGRKIVFGFFRAGTNQSDIFTANRDGTHLRRVTKTAASEHMPDWGPHPLEH